VPPLPRVGCCDERRLARRLLVGHLAIELEDSEAAHRRDHQFADGPYERVDAIRRAGSPINIRREGAHLILELREDAQMMHAPLFVEGADGLGARYLAARGADRRTGDVRIYDADRVLDHVAALVDFGDDSVGTVSPVCRDGIEAVECRFHGDFIGLSGGPRPAARRAGHLCYGSPADEHCVQPKDAMIMVEMTNAITVGVKRPIQFFHLPVPKGRTDDAYYVPLETSSAGPRGPAVMMLVLSATGAPVALVKTFDVDIVNSRVVICVDGIRAAPKGAKGLTQQYRTDLLNPLQVRLI
jgi:hypothetical protein